MAVLIIDLETQGLNKEDNITEIGAQVVSHDFQEVLGEVSCLVYDDSYPPQPPEVVRVTGITDEMLRGEGVLLQDAGDMLASILPSNLEYVVAYNAEFDEAVFKHHGAHALFPLVERLGLMFQVPWLCAMRDVPSNYQYQSWKLMHLALEYGVAVNPRELHRAINDVDLTRQMLAAAKTTSHKMHAFKQEPWVYVRAICKPPWEDNGQSTDAAKKLGFTWERVRGDDKRFEKSWVKRVKESHLEALINDAPFTIRTLGGV